MSKRRHVVIGLPSYAGTVHIGTMRSLMCDVLALQAKGVVVSLDDECANTVIANARARIVHRFLTETDGTDLVFVDNDVLWQAHGLQRLLSYPVDVVGGAYPKRKDPIEFPVHYVDGEAGPVADHKLRLLKMGAVSGGFTRWTRHALQRLTDHYREDLSYDEDGLQIVGLFESYKLANGQKLSEDYAICRRWTDIGGAVYLDPEIRMGHMGLKCFEGQLGRWDAEKEKAA